MGLTAVEALQAERVRGTAAARPLRGTGLVRHRRPGSPPRPRPGDHAPAVAAQGDTARGPAGHDFGRITLSAGPPWPAPAAAGVPLAALEQDADRVADEVTRPGTAGEVTSPAAAGADGGRRLLRSAASAARSADASPAVAEIGAGEVLRSPGLPLDDASRAPMEARFGHDFSQVRVHADARAAASARAADARAYTIGHDMVFADGAYAPRTPAGARLLAHELAHVVQQRQSGRLLVQRAPAGDTPPKALPPTASPPTAPPARAAAAKSKVKRLTVTKKDNGFDDFEAKRGGGTALGYHHGSEGDTFFANFRFQVQVDVEGDINTCKYEQTLDKTTSFGDSSGDDTYDELKQRPLTTKEWVKVSGSSVLWIDAPGTFGHKKADLPYSFKGKFTQSATGGDGERVGAAWSVEYKLGKDEKWEKATDGLDKSASHS